MNIYADKILFEPCTTEEAVAVGTILSYLLCTEMYFFSGYIVMSCRHLALMALIF